MGRTCKRFVVRNSKWNFLILYCCILARFLIIHSQIILVSNLFTCLSHIPIHWLLPMTDHININKTFYAVFHSTGNFQSKLRLKCRRCDENHTPCQKTQPLQNGWTSTIPTACNSHRRGDFPLSAGIWWRMLQGALNTAQVSLFIMLYKAFTTE